LQTCRNDVLEKRTLRSIIKRLRKDGWLDERVLAVQSRSVVESAMLMLHSGRPYGTDSSRQRQDHARRPSCYTAIEGLDPRARQPLRSYYENVDDVAQARLPL